MSALADRAGQAPWGLFGGEDGSHTRIEISPAGSDEFVSFQEHFRLVSPTKFTNVRLHRGDRVRLTAPSGAGYGPAIEREPEAVAADVREGYVTSAQARSIYRVAVDDRGSLDAIATAGLRAEPS